MRRTRAQAFVDKLAGLRFDNAFNPYAEACPDHDRKDAAAIRKRNLKLVLDAALRNGVDSVWIARDLGYKGGRRTGLPLTDEVHLAWYAALLATPPLKRATNGQVVAERTATVVWHTLRSISRPIFLWNVFPLHPHAPADPMSNRSHTRAERESCRPLLLCLLDMLQPNTVVAIGRNAHAALRDLGIAAFTVRHPSYGGESDFVSGLTALYKLPELADQPSVRRARPDPPFRPDVTPH